MIKLKPKFIKAKQHSSIPTFNATTETQTKTIATNSVVTLAQSEELMQTLLSTSFSCLTYLRGLFVDENFYDEKFTVKSPGTNTSFDSSQGYVSSSQKSRDAIRIKKLKRGVSSEGDLFLDWIERGVFDAFHRKYLKALMFTIYLNSQKPSEIVELYTFSFSYNNKDNMLLQTEGRIGNHSIKMDMNTTDIRRDIQALIRKFIMIVQSLAPLPERRFLSMKLVYNESAPEEYQPPFFRDCSNETDTQFMVHQNEDICTLKAGCVDAGFHAISVNVASIVDSHFGNEENLSSGRKKKFVNGFDFIEPEFKWESNYGNYEGKQASLVREKSLDPSKTTENVPLKLVNNPKLAEKPQPSLPVNAFLVPEIERNIMTPMCDQMVDDLSIASDGPSRVSSTYEEEKNNEHDKYQNMSVDDGYQPPLSQVTENLKNMFANSLPENFDLTQRIPDSLNMPGFNKDDETTDDEESLGVPSDNEDTVSEPIFGDNTISPSNMMYGYDIDCICHKNTYLDFSPVWAKCTKCNCLSHFVCYGYAHKRDEKLKGIGKLFLEGKPIKDTVGLHECYSCVKGIKDAEVPLKTQLVILIRKLIHFYQKEKGLNFEAQLMQICEKFICNSELIRFIHQILVDEGYVKIENGIVLACFGRSPFCKRPYNKPMGDKFYDLFYNSLSVFDLKCSYPKCIDDLYDRITSNKATVTSIAVLDEDHYPKVLEIATDHQIKRQKISICEDPLQCFSY